MPQPPPTATGPDGTLPDGTHPDLTEQPVDASAVIARESAATDSIPIAGTNPKPGGRHHSDQFALVLVSTLLWICLWGAISWLNLVTGLLLGLLVTRVFYLPPVQFSGRFHVGWFLVYFVRFLYQVVVASFGLAIRAFSRVPVHGNSVIAVPLRTRSDLVLTITGLVAALVPGSIVVDIDRSRAVLYLHVFNTSTLADSERMRQRALTVEAQVLRVMGSREECDRLAAESAT
ncbi:Na+/H+ antiporter subunit E [Marisediminicola senii]|uniref:Na+/H+ antiporter subunit E n=1 Tax=Marisediminicola senii TaxID=2711233 RepID=UPI0013EC47D5|nr:Na+/H+ antiporter subunit E [Marisediminicola senii]